MQYLFLIIIFGIIQLSAFSQISSNEYCEMGKKKPDSTYHKFDRKASFKGETDSSLISNKIMRYVGRNIGRYTGKGIVCLSFVVNENGWTEEVIAFKSQDEELSRMSVNLIKQMPKWRPAILDGEKVKVEFKVPFRFTQP